MLPFFSSICMQSDRTSSGLLLAGVFALVAAAAILFWFVSAPVMEAPNPPPGTVHAVPKQAAPSDSPESSTRSTTPVSVMPLTVGANVPADHAVGTILAANPTVDGAREKLLEAFPGFSEQEKIAAAPHLVNLVTDEHLPNLVTLIKDPSTPTAVKEVIFDNLMNRPPVLGWPVLLQVMAIPGHPLAQRARETLTIVVGANHGDRLDEWQKALNAQLRIQGQ